MALTERSFIFLIACSSSLVTHSYPDHHVRLQTCWISEGRAGALITLQRVLFFDTQDIQYSAVVPFIRGHVNQHARYYANGNKRHFPPITPCKKRTFVSSSRHHVLQRHDIRQFPHVDALSRFQIHQAQDTQAQDAQRHGTEA